jgi:predicted amidophosphoribosyltransferase
MKQTALNSPWDWQRAARLSVEVGHRAAGAARWFRRAAAELAFPATCAGCEVELGERAAGAPPFCDDCLQQVRFLGGATCRRCAARVPEIAVGQERCYLCRDTTLWFDEAIATGAYEGLLREWLLEMKEQSGERRAFALAELAWQRSGERIAALAPDVVVPVPMHWRRRLARGTNSAAILGEVLAERLHVPFAPQLVRRVRNTPPQSSVAPSERPGNVRGAFAVRAGYYLEAARVLVVDDILTSGSTASALARVLKRSGAAHVAVAVIGRAGQH